MNNFILLFFTADPLGTQFCPPFCDTVIREHHWFWKPNTTSRVKSVSTLVSEYLTSVGRGCHMILNLNPDPYGLVEEEDMQAYMEFGEAVSLLYKNLVFTDKNPELKVGVEIVWSLPELYWMGKGAVVIMENIAEFGQLVEEYQLRFKTLNGWLEYPEQGSSVGQKRIHAFPAAFTGEIISAISLNVTKLVTNGTSITLREVSVYDWNEAGLKGYV